MTITASVPGWATASGVLAVSDGPSATLTVTGPPTVTEGDGFATASVSISAPLPNAVNVALLSNDPATIATPQTVTIPSGLTNAAFPLTIKDDAAFDGAQNVTITVTASGFANSAALAVSAGDNELYSLRFLQGADKIVRGVPFKVTLIASDIKGAPILNYADAITLSGIGSRGPIAVSPTEVRDFVNGVWSGYVTVLDFDDRFVLVAEDTNGHRTTTAEGEDGQLIEVTRGGAAYLTVSDVPSPQKVGKPFSFTVTAFDEGNNIADFGPDFVSVRAGVPREPVNIGSGMTAFDFPIGASFKAARSQVIYPASELGAARRLTSLSLNVATLPAQLLQGWVIRMKHTLRDSYDTAAWETTGWTTLCQQ